jgi:hypothetical protein
MHHRAEVIHILTRLGLKNVLEGDVLSWEQQLQSTRPFTQAATSSTETI